MEEKRDLADGNLRHNDMNRTQSRETVENAVARIRKAADKDGKQKFTALFHHVYNIDTLTTAFYLLGKKAAPGVDGVTWYEYEKSLEENLQELHHRLRRGAYRPKPTRRVFIPKADGTQRPIAVTAIEDKIVQRAMVLVLNGIYEADFLGFSRAFRPGRSQHQALDALDVALRSKRINWVLDADIRGYFDAINHDWLIKFLEHRIADKRILRHVKKWLHAGVLEDGNLIANTDQGCPQGGSVCPLLANIYLHYVFDLWAHHWRDRRAKGDVIMVRWADDIIVGFQHKADAERFQADLKERFEKFNLELHPQKTRLIEFGRFAAPNREKRGEGKPETFDFLGFTHICATKRNGKFTVKRITAKKKMCNKLRELKAELRKRINHKIPETGMWLASVLRGHYQYYAIPLNFKALASFREALSRLWKSSMLRKSGKAKCSWERMRRLVDRWLPLPRILHPYPYQRFASMTGGRNPVH
jgi:group II intron reverse transcriptase/maturase